MTPHHNCRLCGLGTAPAQVPSYYSTALFESASFVAVPSIGSIVPGWMLIVPRAHVLRASDLSVASRDELADFVAHVRRNLTERFGPTSIFEHGPARPGCTSGCTVDHAHVH